MDKYEIKQNFKGKIHKLHLRFELMIESTNTFRKYPVHLLSANNFGESTQTLLNVVYT